MGAAATLSCVLFDLDGTLVDTTALIFASYRHTLRAVFGYEASDGELLKEYGRPLSETMRGFLRALGQKGAIKLEAANETDQPVATVQAEAGPAPDEAMVDRLVKVYREYNLAHHDALIRSFPGAEETLAELRRRGYTLGIVTSKGRRTTLLSLGHYGLERCLSAIVTLEDTQRHKPHAEPVLKALSVVGKTPAETLFVGDSVFDIMAGRAAGVQTGAALWGPFPRADLAAQRPDYLFETITDLLEVCPPLDKTE